MRAWWSGTAGELAAAAPEAVIGALARRLVETHALNHEEQIRAWRAQLPILTAALAGCPGWRVLLEYPLIRLGRRIDAVVLGERGIFVLEFKIGAARFANADRLQVEDYALDLFDFHAESRRHPIVPVLVAPDAPARAATPPLLAQPIMPVMEANAASLGGLIAATEAMLPAPAAAIDAAAWEAGAYRPVPTIVEAATMLYRRHGVEEIAAARADVSNLTRTTEAIGRAVDRALAAGERVVVFVTGIPGAGKTLCGLNTVFRSAAPAAFLTGNLPLVHVLREALARDAKGPGMSLRAANHRLDSAIQPLLGFLRDNVPRAAAPHERVIVFDEAQRAWDAAFGQRKFQLDDSEAGLFLDIMARHEGGAAIVALVGNGQEINTGEAGLASWGEALARRPGWRIVGPDGVIGHPDPARRLADAAPAGMEIDPALHLDVSVRQVRSAAAAAWIDAVLDGRAEMAAGIASAAGGVPFRITRSLDAMRAALRGASRGTRRAGLVCSAGAKRLRAEGLSADFPHMDRQAVASWFLNAWPDVRASDALEAPATQYACQGLEIDNVGLCWGGDLIRPPVGDGWMARRFRGTRWEEIRHKEAASWQVNTYRVLLSRARYETVIFVPPGDAGDGTRPPAEFDRIAAFLAAAGAAPLAVDARAEAPAPLLFG